MTEYKFKTSELEAQIETLSQKGITEFSIHDASVAKDKRRVLKIINLIAQYAPDVFVSILTDASVIDREVAAAATQIFCSFDSGRARRTSSCARDRPTTTCAWSSTSSR